ncbi:MAG TPA: BatA domain-containing protein, partial [Rhodothermales bacterium]|nr:BatA domain-containing protein [Rhodothermales bacterium]
MTFLNPLLLLGLAAAALPVLLHLFNQRRPREVVFSSVALLKDVQATTTRRVRIEERLLLLLRVLALACLALGFARPVLEGRLAGLGEAPVSVALVVDNSLSTAQRAGGRTLLDASKAEAEAFATALAPGDEVFVVPTAPEGPTPPAPLRSSDAVLARVDALGPRAGATPLSSALDRALALLEGARHRNRLVVAFTDAQASTLLDSSAMHLPGEARLVVVPMAGEGAVGNVAVTDARLLTEIVEAGQPVEVEITVARFGEGSAPVPVRLRQMTGAGPQGRVVAEGSVSPRPGSPGTVRLRFTPTARGQIGLYAEAAGGDAFPEDDRRALVLRVPEVRRVLVVRGTPARALDALLAPGLLESGTPFDADDANAATLARARLDDYDAVILVAPATLPAEAQAALVRYVQGGGGLIAFAGEANASLSALLTRLGAGGIGAPQALPEGAVVSRVDAAHPLFAGVYRAAPGRRVEPEAVAVRRAAPLRGGLPLVTLSSGGALVTEARSGQGRVLVIGVAPEPGWSDLPASGLFVPLVLRGLLVAGRSAGGAGEAALAGRGPALRIAGTYAQPLSLVGPEGDRAERRITPPQRVAAGATYLDPDVATPGLYAVRSGDSLVARVALHEDPRESDLRRLSRRDLATQLAEVAGRRVEVTSGAAEGAWRATDQETTASGQEVWNV